MHPYIIKATTVLLVALILSACSGGSGSQSSSNNGDVCSSNFCEDNGFISGIHCDGSSKVVCNSNASGCGVMLSMFDCPGGCAAGQCTNTCTIDAQSCSQQDVQAAVDSAGEGCVVTIPAGDCSWNTPVNFFKSITVAGAGIDNTTITDETSATWAQAPFWIQGDGSIFVRITGLTFRDLGHSDSYGKINLWGNGINFRIDHIRFQDIAGRAVIVHGKSYGVINHCAFIQPGGQGVWVSDGRGSPAGSTSWEEAMSFGTADAVYIENNSFLWGSAADGAVDCVNGGRITFRYNSVQGIMAGNHGMDSRPRSCMQMEIYDNAFVSNSHSVFVAVQSRGGTGIFFENTIDDNFSVPIGITNYRSCCYAGAMCTPSPDPPHGDCDGTNPLDGNTSPASVYKGWPCRDQIGRGTAQQSEPLYEWSNTQLGVDVDVEVYNYWSGCVDPQPSDHVQANRDYFNDTPRPGYVPYIFPHPLSVDNATGTLLALEVTGTSSNQMNLGWSAINGAENYRIYRNWQEIGSETGLSCSDNGLQPATDYIYIVKALDAANQVLAAEGKLVTTDP